MPTPTAMHTAIIHPIFEGFDEFDERVFVVRAGKRRFIAKLKEKNIGILITDHNVHETLTITDRAYLLFEGKILKEGTAIELANDEQVRRVYLGQNFELRK